MTPETRISKKKWVQIMKTGKKTGSYQKNENWQY